MSENSPPQTPSFSQRRGSFNPSQKLTELFSRQPSISIQTSSTSSSSPPNSATTLPPNSYSGSLANNAANSSAQTQSSSQQNQRRRMSLSSTLGLSGSPTSPTSGTAHNPSFSGWMGAAMSASRQQQQQRRSSGSESSTGSVSNASSPVDMFGGSTASGAGYGIGGGGGGNGGHNNTNESAIDESDAFPGPASNGAGNGSANGSPFTRRMSFGARALNSARGAEGFNWSDQLRSRAQRSSSITMTSTTPPSSAGHSRQMSGNGNNHVRAASIAVVEPVKEIPKPLPPKAPDPFQERILKGDFYMD
ncbi:hypothetical protein MMC25_001507 [Agyrium rufum]|nr:hypothetical protein [Agyrium rufum]